MSTGPSTAELVASLIERGLSLATAESLTGGAVATELVGVPGVSATFQGGVVAYQNSVKASVLGVSEELLERVGSVDGEVAVQMALGVCRITGANVGLATTGAAGPEAHDGKAVGTVFLAVALNGVAQYREYHFDGDREAIRAQARHSALSLLADVVNSSQQTFGKQPGTKQFDR
ncbi:nicotinamide-nucleotide amidase [Psychromicrobium silvestre]|uniref:Nicotinamide-nucleotide amidase n=1 Tax=Psychromicrobium silvestre TaxID=1645614 RepID=A0A7Y9S982_9MICC|nr:CinA family protein [Psychromicrobium silvestre]NYE96741.1 nicotinamide-nucleotide amidase [Psychromicrobium silvestre]